MPSECSPKDAATISASGVLWLTAVCFFGYATDRELGLGACQVEVQSSSGTFGLRAPGKVGIGEKSGLNVIVSGLTYPADLPAI